MPPRKVSGEERELVEKANKYLPAGSLGNLAADLIIREGRGGHVWDASGNEYVDFLLGSGPMLVGHAHPEVVEAVEAAKKYVTEALRKASAAVRLRPRSKASRARSSWMAAVAHQARHQSSQDSTRFRVSSASL